MGDRSSTTVAFPESDPNADRAVAFADSEPNANSGIPNSNTVGKSGSKCGEEPPQGTALR
jgi:hypothetical protein